MKRLLIIIISFLLPLTLLSQQMYVIGAGEYQCYILNLFTGVLSSAGLGATGAGSNTGTPGLLVVGSFPGTPFIMGVSSCLHSGHCYDNTGKEYVTGLNDNSSLGLGTGISGESSWVQIVTDSSGSAFNNVVGVFDFANSNGSGSYAWKGDGSLWGMGRIQGLRGDGTNIAVDVPRPVLITGISAGDSVIDCKAGPVIVALTRNGSAYSIYTSGLNSAWTGNGTSDGKWHKLSLSFTPKSIHMGVYWWFILGTDGNIRAIGWYQNVWGGTLGSSPTTPTNIMSNVGLPSGSVAKMSAGCSTVAAILNDGSLWSWGDNITSAIGIGSAKTNWFTYSLGGPFAWDQNQFGAENQVQTAVKMDSCNTFISVVCGTTYGLYTFAETSNHVLENCGRNKNAVLANGVIGADYVIGNIESTYPDSYDTMQLSPIYPYNDANGVMSYSSYCAVHPSGSPCNAYAIPTNTAPIISNWSNATITGTSYSFNPTITPNSATIANIRVKVIPVSGCPTQVVAQPYNANTTISNLSLGPNVIQITATDTKMKQTMTQATITVVSIIQGSLILSKRVNLSK